MNYGQPIHTPEPQGPRPPWSVTLNCTLDDADIVLVEALRTFASFEAWRYKEEHVIRYTILAALRLHNVPTVVLRLSPVSTYETKLSADDIEEFVTDAGLYKRQQGKCSSYTIFRQVTAAVQGKTALGENFTTPPTANPSRSLRRLWRNRHPPVSVKLSQPSASSTL